MRTKLLESNKWKLYYFLIVSSTCETSERYNTVQIAFLTFHTTSFDEVAAEHKRPKYVRETQVNSNQNIYKLQVAEAEDGVSFFHILHDQKLLLIPINNWYNFQCDIDHILVILERTSS